MTSCFTGGGLWNAREVCTCSRTKCMRTQLAQLVWGTSQLRQTILTHGKLKFESCQWPFQKGDRWWFGRRSESLVVYLFLSAPFSSWTLDLLHHVTVTFKSGQMIANQTGWRYSKVASYIVDLAYFRNLQNLSIWCNSPPKYSSVSIQVPNWPPQDFTPPPKKQSARVARRLKTCPLLKHG